jgi:hypothetical protein
VAASKTVLAKLGGHASRCNHFLRDFRAPGRSFSKFALACCVFSCFPGTSVHASNLKPETAAAFDRYIAATETQMDDDLRAGRFLIVDRLPELERRQAYQQLQRGEPFVEELNTQKDNVSIPVPGGLIHHWAGVMFLPKATLEETKAVLNDYQHQPEIYKPDVRVAKLLEQHGDASKIFEQFYSKSIISVVLNVYFDVVQTQMGNTRSRSVSRATRIEEVENFGTPSEHERNDGKDHGYMWRLNSYWRIEEKDGGVYVQNETISLSRPVPALLAWIINPLTKSIPRELLVRLLDDTRTAVLKRAAPLEQKSQPSDPR